jgi:hypothetical protein
MPMPSSSQNRVFTFLDLLNECSFSIIGRWFRPCALRKVKSRGDARFGYAD